MKKTILFVLIALFSACSKSNQNPATTTIIYQYTATTSSTYNVSYNDGNGNPVTTTFTGTSWSKTITTNAGTGFKKAIITMNTTSATPNITGSVAILVNNVIKFQSDVMLNTAYQGFSYYAVVFN